MPTRPVLPSVNRREFLATTGSLLAAPAVSGAVISPGASAAPNQPAVAPPPATAKKIPIGVFESVYKDLSLDQMLDTITAIGIEAVEVGTGGYPNSLHCPVAELLADAGKARAWKKKFDDRKVLVGAFSCHGNPVHPDPKKAQHYNEAFRHTVLLAERLEVPVIVGLSGRFSCGHDAQLGHLSLAAGI